MTKAKKAKTSNEPLPPFKVEGMTVSEILALDPDTINRMGERDISRALRTVALAANKRVRRLKAHAELSESGVGYLPKMGNEHNIAVNALNAVTRDGMRTGNPFGVKLIQGETSKDRVNAMRKQISEIRQFMSAKTSKVSGAKEVRQNRERKLYGKTTEDFIKGLSLEERKAVAAKIQQNTSDVYKAFRMYNEHQGIPNYPYTNYAGSEAVLELLKTKIDDGASVEEALKAALEKETENYEAQKEAEKALRPSDEEGLNISGV